MDEKIIFLGVGGDTQLTSKQDLASGGIVLQSEGMQFHIDPGPGALVRAKQCGVNVRSTTAILVTHSHLNHCNDVNALIAACSYAGIDRNAVLVAPKSVVELDERGFSVLTPFHKDCVERIITVEPGKKIGIDKIEIHATPTQHTEKHAVGYKFFTPQYTVGFTGDTEYFKGLGEAFKGSTILVMNIKEPFGKKSPGNLNADDAVKLVEEVKPELVLVTHYGVKMVQENPLHIAREIQKITKVQTIATKDGMMINPVSYSSGNPQQTLIQYK